MTTTAPAPEDVLEKVDTLGPLGTPVTTPEVAEGFDCTQRTIYNRLETLVDDSVLKTKKVGANSRVWWRPGDGDIRRNGGAFDQRVPVALRDRQAPSFPTDSEMAKRIREFEWAETPVGSMTEWPPELRVAVDIMLGASEAIGIYWGDDRRLLYNDAAIEQIGEKHPDALGQPAQDVFPEAWETLGPIHDRVMAGDEPVREEELYLPLERAGELEDIWWDSSYNPIPTGYDSIGGVFNIAFDVTERVQAERELREHKEASESKYRTLFESIDEGFCIIEMLLDEDDKPVDYRFLETNPAFEEITDLPNAEGERILNLVPDQEDHWFEIYGQVARTGEDVRFTEHAEHIGDRWYDVYAFRIGDPDERKVAVLFDDITERKEAEEKLRKNEARLSDILEQLPLGVGVLDADGIYELQNDRLEEIIDGDLLPSRDPEKQQKWSATDDDGDPLLPKQWPGARALRGEEVSPGIEFKLEREGETRWFDVAAVPFEEAEEGPKAIGVVQEITERKEVQEALRESEATLERLNAVTQELIDAETATIADRVAPLVRDVLDVEYASLWRYDDRSGDLEEFAADVAPNMDVQPVDLPTEIPDQAWETFVGIDVDVENDLDVPTDATEPLRSRAFVPLGRHGVVCLGSTRADSFDERTVDLLETVAATVETAWNRAAGEQELAHRNEELTRLDRLNTLIREIDQALVTADTCEDIDEAVCGRLADSDLYEFVWIGAFDADADAIRPRSWAGVDGSTVEKLAVMDDDAGVASDPFVTAIRTREMQVIEDIVTDTRTGSWREVALRRGARSCFKIPLIYDDSAYGVLVVYGRSPAQTHRDTDVLAEFGQTIAYSINAIETRDTFQAESVVELTLRSTAADTPLCRLSRAIGSELEFEGLVPGTDDVVMLFFSVSGVASEQVVATGENVLGIEELTPLTTREDCTTFRAQLSDPSLASHVLAQNATVRSIRIDSETSTAVVDLPGSASVRAFVDGLTQEIADLELLSRRTRTREPGSTLQTAVLEQLTPRQQEVLQLAYRSGYFEMPRDQTGEELADTLGIVPSTFTKHIRSAERNLLDVIFVDGHELPEPGAK
ncbi:bacterio-opsin activator domain-containing protein [Natrialbaceae archaeon A-CW3]